MKIYQNIKNMSERKVKILGIIIYKKFLRNNCIIRKYLYGLFYSKEKNGISKYYFLGIKFLKKINIEQLINNKLSMQTNTITLKVQRSITTALLHQKTFLPFKNCNQGKTVVLIGAGPTVNEFIPIKNAIYCGLNRAFLYNKVQFDYLFTIDKLGICNYYDQFLNYMGNSCIKFIGDQNANEYYQIPESYALKMKCLRYKTTANFVSNKFTLDIDSEPIGNFHTVSLQAMQFLLYTNPKKIYVVGIDCTFATAGHFIGNDDRDSGIKRGQNLIANDLVTIENWKQLKKFVDIYYPEIEIISVNPVNLKGVFKDIYTSNSNYVDVSGNILDLSHN